MQELAYFAQFIITSHKYTSFECIFLKNLVFQISHFFSLIYFFLDEGGTSDDDDRKSIDSYGSVGGRGKGGNDRINVPRTYSDDIAT